jgi:polyphenol oxidase
MKTMSQGAFSYLNQGRFRILQCDDARRTGFIHGFIGVSADFSVGKNRAVSVSFCETMEVSHLILLNQVHSDKVLVLHEDENEPMDRLVVQSDEADAVIGRRSSRAQPYAVGIRTADCVPLLVQAGEYSAAIHAGWRGLAQGIISNTLQKLHDLQSKKDSSWVVIIGPCAGKDAYEVGPEILPEFRSSPSLFRRKGRLYLDLASTASAQVEQSLALLNQNGLIYLSDTCTIQDLSFHSHRRDKERRGSNMSYIIT